MDRKNRKKDSRPSWLVELAHQEEKKEKCGCRGYIDVSTSKGRRNHAILVMLLSLTPVVSLLIQNGMDIYNEVQDVSIYRYIKDRIQFSVQIGNVVHCTQKERGTTAHYVSSKGDQMIYRRLEFLYADTDKAITNLSREKWNWTKSNLPYFRTPQTYHQRIIAFRHSLKHNDKPNKKVEEVIQFYTDDNEVLQGWIGQSIQNAQNCIDSLIFEHGDLWRKLVAYYMLILSKEQAGIERAMGSIFYTQGNFSEEERKFYYKCFYLGHAYLNQSAEYSSEIKHMFSKNYTGSVTQNHIRRMHNDIHGYKYTKPDAHVGTLWFDNMTVYIDFLKRVQDYLASSVIQKLSEESEELESTLIISISLICVAVAVLLFVSVAVYRLTLRMHTYATLLQARTREVDIERKRSERLLFELLPSSIALKLLNYEEVPPESFSAVSICFTDIVDFTGMSSRSSPKQVICMLNELYHLMDAVLERYKVYKVETIGDAYMIASGVPNQNVTGHAREMALAALGLINLIKSQLVPHLPGEKTEMRIGINSGPVVAGIVGCKMPRFCVLGDTVNVASRMESTSLAQKIQISAATKKELDKSNGFKITERGSIQIKGKGDMVTFWLESQKTTNIFGTGLGQSDLHVVQSKSSSSSRAIGS